MVGTGAARQRAAECAGLACSGGLQGGGRRGRGVKRQRRRAAPLLACRSAQPSPGSGERAHVSPHLASAAPGQAPRGLVGGGALPPLGTDCGGMNAVGSLVHRRCGERREGWEQRIALCLPRRWWTCVARLLLQVSPDRGVVSHPTVSLLLPPPLLPLRCAAAAVALVTIGPQSLRRNGMGRIVALAQSTSQSCQHFLTLSRPFSQPHVAVCRHSLWLSTGCPTPTMPASTSPRRRACTRRPAWT